MGKGKGMGKDKIKGRAAIDRRSFVRRGVAALGLMVAGIAAAPQVSLAQVTPCINCTLYARTNLNLRHGPALSDPILTVVPRGGAVHRGTEPERNGYAHVSYNGVSGWVVTLGLVRTLAELDPLTTTTTTPGTAPVATAVPVAPVTSANDRVALTDLVLRSGPSPDDAPILAMPAGAIITLTHQGAANGYVTVTYGGTTGWVYADLIGPV